jgi:hypothetical protein
MFWFFLIYLGLFMLPPYFYSFQNQIIAQIKNDQIRLLEEWVDMEEMTSWSNLLSHVAFKEVKILTCKKGCCKFWNTHE